MQNIKEAFDQVHASQQLKDSTKEFLQQQNLQIVRKKPAVLPRLAAACLTFLLFVSSVTAVYFIPVSAIHVESDPSDMQLKINCFDRVIAVDGNEHHNELNHMSYEDAMAQLLTDTQQQETIITVVGNDKMLSDVESCLQNDENVSYCHMNKETAQKAAALGISTAKYSVWLSLTENGVDITAQQAQQMSMKELRSLLNEAQSDTADTTATQATEQQTEHCESASDDACNDPQGNHGNGNHYGQHH